MLFKLFLLLCNMLIPLFMIISGIIFEKNPPKNINGLYGYSTTMSMKNNETWNFAHECCGKIWKKVGIIIMLLSLILTLISFGMSDNTWGNVSGILVTIQTIILILSIFPVERELKKNFDKSGKRK